MFKRSLGLEKLTVKKLCVLAMLTALTAVLAIYCTFRVGTLIKIPLKFITVFISAALFGPVWGGVVALLGDILNAVLMPVGLFLPQVSAVEFLYGFIFGLFYYKKYNKGYIKNTILCALLLTLIDLFLMSYILTTVGIFANFAMAVTMRFAASLIKFALYILICLLLKKHLVSFERLMNK